MYARHENNRSPKITVDDGIEVSDATGDHATERAHRRFGGIDGGAIIGGLLATTGMIVIVGGLATALGSAGYQLDLERSTERLSTGGFVAGVVILVASALSGGWVAGRIARYDGGRNGLLAVVVFLLLASAAAAAGASLGNEYDVFRNIDLPRWFSDDSTRNTAALVASVVGILVMLGAGYLGGEAGERWHRGPDDLIARTRDGGVVQGTLSPRTQISRSEDRGRRSHV